MDAISADTRDSLLLSRSRINLPSRECTRFIRDLDKEAEGKEEGRRILGTGKRQKKKKKKKRQSSCGMRG